MKPALFAPAALALLVLAGCAPLEQAPEDPDYIEQIEQYRADREERLRQEGSWLTLVGLVWLEPGENPFGTDPGNKIVFPEGSSAPVAGSIQYDGERALLSPGPDANLTIDGEPVSVRELSDDSEGDPDIVRLGGRLSFHVIERDSRHAVRVKDSESPVRTGFSGLDYFPIDREFRVVGRFRPFEEPREVALSTVVGTIGTMLAPGEIEFSVNGEAETLLPLVSDQEDTEFFLIFRDSTSGAETYGAGRYLYADLVDGEVVLDFNKAYNPPCVFTPFATCSLPPAENRLAARLEAGERVYGAH